MNDFNKKISEKDPAAMRELDSKLSFVAKKILDHSSFNISSQAPSVLREVKERGAPDFDSYLGNTIMVACRRGIENLREKNPMEGSNHIPSNILVSLALVPDALARPAYDAAMRHIGECADCTMQVRLIKDITEEATKAFNSYVPDPDPDTAVKDQASALMEQMLVDEEPSAEKVKEKAQEFKKRKQAGQKGKKRKNKKYIDDKPSPIIMSILGFLILSMVVVMIVRSLGNSEEKRVEGLDVLADFDLPEAPSSWDLAPDAFQDYDEDRCDQAVTRFRKARLANPAEAQLWYWEGIACLCDNQGEPAFEALNQALNMPPIPKDLFWYLAQAALLTGREDSAEKNLEKVCSEPGENRTKACDLLQRL